MTLLTLPDSPPVDLPPPVAAAPVRAGRWSRLARRWPELSVVAVALVLFAWGLGLNGEGNTYYAAAARSMTSSWKNFFYASFDPGGWITVDKPPMALWLQAASAKVFGFSSWSLLMPSVLCGVGSVWLLMSAVRRAWGRTAGLVAGVTLALTPVIIAVSRSNNPDMTLVFFMVFAGYATQRAISDRKPGWLYAAGALVGLAFLSKLLVAAVVLPGLWLAYLLYGPSDWKRRIGHLALATLAFVGVAGAWVAAVDLVPVGTRPWIGGSTDGTAWDLVFGYNGFGRVFGASAGPGGGGRPGGFGAAGGIDQFGGVPGLTRLFNNGMGDQVMWLAPVAALALAAGLFLAVRRRLRRQEAGAVVLWGGWAAATYLVFAYAEGIYHNYYVAALAPAMAALVGIGVALVRRYRRAGLVAVAVAALATAALHRVFLDRVDAYEWLRIIIPAGLVAVAVASVAAALRPAWAQRAAPWFAGAGLAIALVPAAIWTWSATQTAQSGTFPDARPGAASGGAFAGPGGGGGGGGGFGGGLGFSEQQLEWLRSEQTTERWLVAVGSSQQASAAIINGDSVMAMGGFTGSDPAMTVERLAGLVEAGDLRFVSSGAGGGPGGFGGGGTGLNSVVQEVCTSVDASAWGGSGASGIYDCRGQAGALRAAAPAVSEQPTGGQIPGGGQFPGGGQAPGGSQFPGGGQAPGGFPDMDSDAMAEFQQCLAENGLDVGAGPPDLSDDAAQQAFAACQDLLPAGGPGRPPGS